MKVYLLNFSNKSNQRQMAGWLYWPLNSSLRLNRTCALSFLTVKWFAPLLSITAVHHLHRVGTQNTHLKNPIIVRSLLLDHILIDSPTKVSVTIVLLLYHCALAAMVEQARSGSASVSLLRLVKGCCTLLAVGWDVGAWKKHERKTWKKIKKLTPINMKKGWDIITQ